MAGKVRQELLDFGRPQVARLAFAEKQYELPGPVELARRRSRRVMTYPKEPAHLAEQSRGPGMRQFGQVRAHKTCRTSVRLTVPYSNATAAPPDSSAGSGCFSVCTAYRSD
jgi:hypothetical protein